MTLFEVLIVVAILAMISAGVAVAVIGQGNDARLKFARSEAGVIRQAAQRWIFDGGEGCPTVDELITRGVLETNATGKDPWREAYRVTCDGIDVTVVSSGPDRKSRTEDDVVVPLVRAQAAASP